VNDLLTSRLHQFEHTAFTEVEPLFEEFGLDPAQRLGVFAYVKGLQDWQSGGHEWHMRSSRYMNGAGEGDRAVGVLGGPTGIGTSAAQVLQSLAATMPQRARSFGHVPYQQAGQVRRAPVDMPFSTTLSPHLDASRAHNMAWGARMGMLDPEPGVPLPGGVWDEEKLAAFDFALCAAGIHPDASQDELDLTTDWLTWGTYGDDYYPVVFGRSGDMAAARITTERFKLFMPLDAGAVPPPMTVLERSLADLWHRTAGPMAPEARRRFRTSIEDMCESWLWELANQKLNRVPDPVDYIEMRRATFGSDLTMSLSRIGHGDALPDEVYRSRPVHGMEVAAQDFACLLNDVFSYRKEIEFEGEIHNAVLVVQNFLDCGPQEAMDVVGDLMAARMEEFQHITETQLPTLFEEFDLDETAREVLLGYAQELRDWMAGILTWHEGCKRYTEETLLKHFPHVAAALPAQPWHTPAGLGTSAARLPSLLSGR
jgi:germacradienol/geosmin synthase